MHEAAAYELSGHMLLPSPVCAVAANCVLTACQLAAPPVLHKHKFPDLCPLVMQEWLFWWQRWHLKGG